MINERALDLRIEQLSLHELKLDSRNPKLHSDPQTEQIARSIQTYGFNVPIAIDGDGKVLAGHGRLLAAQKLGCVTVPVIRLTHLRPAQARAFSIADNRLTENSTWDDRLLGEIFRDLATQDLDFSLETTGFSVGEIDLRIEGLSTTPASEDPADLIKRVLGQPPVSGLGDLFLMGKHKLLCGDALEVSSYQVLMEKARAHVIFTDSPYNEPIDGHTSGIFASAWRILSTTQTVWRRGGGFEPPVQLLTVQRFSKSVVLAALTRSKVLTVGSAASKSGSIPLIRQLLCSTLCSDLRFPTIPFYPLFNLPGLLPQTVSHEIPYSSRNELVGGNAEYVFSVLYAK
jgi:ParB-like nuclease domain